MIKRTKPQKSNKDEDVDIDMYSYDINHINKAIDMLSSTAYHLIKKTTKSKRIYKEGQQIFKTVAAHAFLEGRLSVIKDIKGGSNGDDDVDYIG